MKFGMRFFFPAIQSILYLYVKLRMIYFTFILEKTTQMLQKEPKNEPYKHNQLVLFAGKDLSFLIQFRRGRLLTYM